IEEVRGKSGEVGQHDPRVFEQVKRLQTHLVCEEIPIGAMRDQRASLRERNSADGRRENGVIDSIEVDVSIADALLSEWNDHKASFQVVHDAILLVNRL